MNSKLFILAACILIQACSWRKQDNAIPSIKLEENLFNNIQQSPFTIGQIIPFVHVAEAPLGWVIKMHAFNDLYYLLSYNAEGKRELHQYQQDGQFVQIIGTLGQGPGEYTDAMDFALCPISGHIYVLNRGNEIIEYAPEGQFLASYTIPGHTSSLALNKQGHFVIYTAKEEELEIQITRTFDKSGQILSQGYYKKLASGPPMENNFQQYADDVFFREYFSHQLFAMEDAEPRAIMAYDWGNKAYRESYNNFEIMKLFEAFSVEGLFYPFRKAMLNDQYVYAAFDNGPQMLIYHVIHDRAGNNARYFMTNPQQDGLLDALWMNANHEPCFFTQGPFLEMMRQSKPEAFEKFKQYVFDDDTNYLISLRW